MDLAAELARYGPAARYERPSAESARAYCRTLAESHYENFTVVSRLFPRHLHQHLCNVYAYCRWADDLADEAGDDAPALLDWWEGQLDQLFDKQSPDQWSGCHGQGKSSLASPRPMVGALDRGVAPPTHPVFIALAETVREFDIRRQPLADLLVAFRRDQTQKRYETMSDLLTYCEHSANPVGRIVLALGRALDNENVHLSDRICTGLQLANFCQDVRRDYESGRIYLPLEWCRRYGWSEEKFAAGRCDDDFRQLLQELVDQADRLLISGRPLVQRVSPDLRLPVRVFVAGGRAILAAIRSARYDVWTRRPTVSRWTKMRLLASSLWSGWWHG
jgi:squalene synthase HpnC